MQEGWRTFSSLMKTNEKKLQKIIKKEMSHNLHHHKKKQAQRINIVHEEVDGGSLKV